MKAAAPAVALLLISLAATAAPPSGGPRPLVDGIDLHLVAEAPQIVTPVGVAFDTRGRLLVVESHTHKRTDDYDGPTGDRVRILADTNGDGRLDATAGDTWATFAEGYTHALNLAAAPKTGRLLLVCRNEVRRLADNDGDGQADEDTRLVRVETDETYPHNGLGGLAISQTTGAVYLGFGENFGKPYRIVGADGSSVEGRGGAGIVLGMTVDGQRLAKAATGFWNPFGLCEWSGRLFCVDNDPHASPPCRLIDVHPGADYGHRWEYSPSGLSPLQAWNGELPGMSGMIAATGEAPTGVVAHRGWLWVTSWGEHRIERYRLTPEGDSFTAEREVVVQGNADFRPTGIAVAPDGSLYFGDWVSRSYPVHGAGRVWRLAFDEPTTEPTAPALPPGPCFEASFESQAELIDAWNDLDGANKLTGLHAFRFLDASPEQELIDLALADADDEVVLYATRWVTDEHLEEYRPALKRLLDTRTLGERHYLATLAAIDWLSREPEPRHSGIADGLLARELRNPRRPPATRALALRLIDPNHKQLTTEALRGYLDSGHPELQAEAVRTLALQLGDDRFALLRSIATSRDRTDSLRAEATAALAGDATRHEQLLVSLADRGPHHTANEAKRVLSLAKLAPADKEPRPAATDLDAWAKLLDEAPGDAASGRRLFHHPLGPRCGVCHKKDGRGGEVGPELTGIGKKLDRARLAESILQPNREVAPQYEAWVLETADGKVLTGLRLHRAGDIGVERYADANGDAFELSSDDIEHRSPSRNSIMPKGLEQLMSVQDFRDLLAYLAQ
ncbi:MAG: PVC-type heme-binding CxxCH protein [Planctomycetota bacterium]